MSIYSQLADMLEQHQPDDSPHGICTTVQILTKFTPQLESDVYDIISRWPEHSGNRDYPVPHPTMDPKLAYLKTDNLWEPTPYGDARRRLYHFVIAELRKI